MDHDYAIIIVAAIGAIGSTIAAWVSRQAVKQTKPISNGFAPDIKRRLDRIEQLITNHIEQHANNDVRKK